jgi:hypothetical protein
MVPSTAPPVGRSEGVMSYQVRVWLRTALLAGLVTVPAFAWSESGETASSRRYADRITPADVPVGAPAASAVTLQRREGRSTSVPVRLPGPAAARR